MVHFSTGRGGRGGGDRSGGRGDNNTDSTTVLGELSRFLADSRDTAMANGFAGSDFQRALPNSVLFGFQNNVSTYFAEFLTNIFFVAISLFIFIYLQKILWVFTFVSFKFM